jgi:hypothetical protein
MVFCIMNLEKMKDGKTSMDDGYRQIVTETTRYHGTDTGIPPGAAQYIPMGIHKKTAVASR